MLIGTILSGLVGLFTALLIEFLKKPKLNIEIGETLKTPDATYLRVKVSNRPICRGLRRLLLRQPASRAYAKIHFLKNDHCREEDARWTSSEEPMRFVSNGQISAASIHALNHIDIYPNRFESIDVAVKFNRDPNTLIGSYDPRNSFIYNNLSSIYLSVNCSKKEHYRLREGKYKIIVKVFSGDMVKEKIFFLRNDWPQDDFRLEPFFES